MLQKGKITQFLDSCPDYFSGCFDADMMREHLSAHFTLHDIDYHIKIWNIDRHKVYDSCSKFTVNSLCAVDSFLSDMAATIDICRPLWRID